MSFYVFYRRNEREKGVSGDSVQERVVLLYKGNDLEPAARWAGGLAQLLRFCPTWKPGSGKSHHVEEDGAQPTVQ